jgi:hypothetical protein
MYPCAVVGDCRCASHSDISRVWPLYGADHRLAATWDAWIAPRGLDRVGAVFLAMAMFVHAGVSTIIVALARRHRVAAAIIVHAWR